MSPCGLSAFGENYESDSSVAFSSRASELGQGAAGSRAKRLMSRSVVRLSDHHHLRRLRGEYPAERCGIRRHTDGRGETVGLASYRCQVPCAVGGRSRGCPGCGIGAR